VGYWLLKTEPDEYSFTDLERDGRAVWDGVTNNAALKHMRGVKAGDEAIVYHTGDERAGVGLARVTSDPYADHAAGDPRLVVFDVEPVRRLARPVTLAEVKADTAFAGWALVRESRLSVMPVPPALWRRLLKLSGM
jgi:predicted RNA-binding protein with PUA-like domain